MKSVFSLNSSTFSLNVLVTDSLEDTFIIQLNGTADEEGSELMSQASDKLLQSHVGSIILDFSKTTSVTTGGWNFIIKLRTLLKERGAELYLMRMPPSVYTHFTEFEFKDHFSHFRAFGDIIRHIKSREESESAAAKQSYSGTHPINEDKETEESTQTFSHEVVEEELYPDSSTESEGSFPLSRSRKTYEQESSVTEFDGEMPGTREDIDESGIPERMIAIRGKLRSLFEMKIYDWKSLGYDTSYLDSYLDKNLDETKKAFSLFAANLSESRRYREILEESDHTDLEKDFNDFSRMTYDPMDIDNIRERFKDFSNKMNRFKKLSNNPLFDYNFENFIKGESNRETYEMAHYLAENLQGHTRPVYIYGGNGTGKTHIMNAIGNKIRTDQGLKVNYITATEFIDKYDEYRLSDHIDRFRNRYTDCEVMLFDDIHMIDGNKELSLEFRLVYEKAGQMGIHLFIASALMPGEFKSLSKDVQSRFNNSVFLTLSEPDSSTLTAIIRSKLNFSDVPFDNGVPEMVSRFSDKNIRQALGYINTLALYHETYKEKVTEDLVRSLILSEEKPMHIRHDEREELENDLIVEEHPFADDSPAAGERDLMDDNHEDILEESSLPVEEEEELLGDEEPADLSESFSNDMVGDAEDDQLIDQEPAADDISEPLEQESDETGLDEDTEDKNEEDENIFEDDFDFEDDDSSWDDDDNDDPFAL